MRKLRKWRDVLIEDLAADHDAAIGFLQAVLADYQIYANPGALVSALRAVIDAQGGLSELAKQTGMDPQTLLEVLSCETAPRVDMLVTILTALGCRLSIEPIENKDFRSACVEVDTRVAPPEAIKSDPALATDNK
ncbi:helix-turn-helix domain-containing protein [Candidatus Poribacteria bacterium]|nr:helix-turn-helix domain-containing protein [Candidatus Poribacteria bacterium]MYA57449.1 helix-turn-helix domain-containing protein [Candidatus Poribacteria bacterium]